MVFVNACKPDKDYLQLRSDKNDNYYYVNIKGNTVIAPGKYSMCYTDTFRNYAIVLKPHIGLVGINREEKILFEVLPFDNGPDYVSEGYFRIIHNGKIGYADKNGNIKITPQFSCAFPFQHGTAKVSLNGKSVPDGEHTIWVSDAWFYIDKSGKRVK